MKDSRGDKASEPTLPVAQTVDLDGQRRVLWQIVLAWHPDPSRIGSVARVDIPRRRPGPVLIGRGMPQFVDASGSVCTIDDPHVSRSACALLPEGGTWNLRRDTGSSRLRLDGEDVEGERELGAGSVAAGFILALGDHVLLHVRRVEQSAAGDGVPATLPSLIGVGSAIAELRARIRAAAATGDDVLLIGPTGTGKELVARAIHDLGPRRSGPWVPVNMAAIPADLAAASLFGARRGAFTGADANRRGYFAQARSGTLFLDEVGDTPPSLQPLLLRALQEREIQVLGGEAERVDLTVVSAMERDPEDPELGFRSALRHRLGVQELRLPALADRREDIGPLVLHFLSRRPDAAQVLPAAAAEQPRWLRLLELLHGYAWPGNVRELENLVGQLVLASYDGELTVPPPLLDRLRRGTAGRHGSLARGGAGGCDRPAEQAANAASGVAEAAGPDGAPRRLCDLDEAAFEAAWEEAGYEPAAMARLLGVSRQAVYRRLKTTRRCRLAADVPVGELAAALDECHGDLIATARRLAVSRKGLELRLRATGLQPFAAPEPEPESEKED